MTIEIFLWIMSCLTVPSIAWAIHMSWSLQQNKRQHDDINKKLEKLLDGAGRQTKVIEDNTRAMNALTYYIKWLAEKQLGEVPPPQIGDPH